MAAWLSRQRKDDLIEFADKAGLEDVKGLRKDELVPLLDEQLQKHAARFVNDSLLRQYYSRTGSPAKRDPSANATDSAVEGTVQKRKRTTKVKDESERSPDALSALVSRITSPSKSTSTPSRSSNLRPSGSHNALRTIAPSPAAVADAIEEQTAKVSQQVHSMIDKSHVGNLFTDVRDVLSSVVGVEGSVLLLEAFNLQQDLMPWVYAFDFPANPTIHMNSQAVYLPNLFILLTGYYWHATLLWAITCFAIPLIASWFFNLTVRSSSKSHSSSKPRWRCDPFTFNVVKALMIWLVFSQGYTYHGLFSHACVDIVRNSMAGGYAGMLIGAFMGIGASMYVAMQRN